VQLPAWLCHLGEFFARPHKSVEAPNAALLKGRTDTGVRVNSDQARELAAALLATADEIDSLAAE